MDAEDELRKLVKWKKAKQTEPAVRLGDVARRYFEGLIEPLHNKIANLADAWERIVPQQLRQHSRIDSLKAGVLKVIVDSPPYLHELRMCSSQLLEELKRHCPKAKINGIKFVAGSL